MGECCTGGHGTDGKPAGCRSWCQIQARCRTRIPIPLSGQGCRAGMFPRDVPSGCSLRVPTGASPPAPGSATGGWERPERAGIPAEPSGLGCDSRLSEELGMLKGSPKLLWAPLHWELWALPHSLIPNLPFPELPVPGLLCQVPAPSWIWDVPELPARMSHPHHGPHSGIRREHPAPPPGDIQAEPQTPERGSGSRCHIPALYPGIQVPHPSPVSRCPLRSSELLTSCQASQKAHSRRWEGASEQSAGRPPPGHGWAGMGAAFSGSICLFPQEPGLPGKAPQPPPSCCSRLSAPCRDPLPRRS